MSVKQASIEVFWIFCVNFTQFCVGCPYSLIEKWQYHFTNRSKKIQSVSYRYIKVVFQSILCEYIFKSSVLCWFLIAKWYSTRKCYTNLLYVPPYLKYFSLHFCLKSLLPPYLYYFGIVSLFMITFLERPP